MEFLPESMLLDFALISLLLFIAQLLRAKIKWVQKLFLPPAMIAGFIGLFLGNYFLGIIPFSSRISDYPFLLIIVLFGTLFLGTTEKISIKQTIDKVGDTLLLNMGAMVGQYGIGMLVGGMIVAKLFPQIQDGFGLLMPAGFVGGHGSAAAIGGTFIDLAEWKEAITIGQTFATAGLLIGVIGGITLINIAVKRGDTFFIKEMGELPEGMRTGFVPDEEREVIGMTTTHAMSIDVLSFHIAVILIAVAIGYGLDTLLSYFVPAISFPLMSLAMIGGVALQQVINKLRLNKYMDKDTITHLGGAVTDYLVAFGIASINLKVVATYALPIIVLLIVGSAFTLLYTFVICKKLFHNYWFERSIFIFGWMTGVTSIGIMLLRIVDPEYKSGILEDYGTAYVFISIIEVLIISFSPLAIIYGYGYWMGLGLTILLIVLLIVSYKMKGKK